MQFYRGRFCHRAGFMISDLELDFDIYLHDIEFAILSLQYSNKPICTIWRNHLCTGGLSLDRLKTIAWKVRILGKSLIEVCRQTKAEQQEQVTTIFHHVKGYLQNKG